MKGRVTVFGKSEDILAMSSDMNLLEFSDEKDASNDPRAVFAVRKQSLTDQSLTEGTLKPFFVYDTTCLMDIIMHSILLLS